MRCISGLSSINPTKFGKSPERVIPSQPSNDGGVETVAVDLYRFKGQIAGMMLGDGCITRGGGKNAYFRMQHTEKQKQYLLHKAEILRQLTAVTIRELQPRGKRNPNKEVTCKTRRHPFYSRVRDIIYPHGIKKVGKTWLCWLTVEGLAIWYMDDGSLSKRWGYNKTGRRRIHSRRVYINTCGFSLEENNLLRDFVEERFGVQFRVARNGEYKGKAYYRLMCGAKEANRFFDIVRPFVIPSMQYKIDMEYDQQPDVGRSPQGSDEPVRTPQECGEAGRNDLPLLIAE